MERLYRILFLGLFILGFVGAIASADRAINLQSFTGSNALRDTHAHPAAGSLIHDVRMVEEINALNEGRWNQDVNDINSDGLARVEAILDRVEPVELTAQNN